MRRILETKNPFLLLVFISILPLFYFFSTTKLIHTHDGLVHLPRIAAYYKALADGQIPVRWAGDLNYGYGMPLFNFIYPLPYLIASVFVFVGFGLVNAFKLTLSLSYIMAGIFMFLFIKELFRNEKKAFFVAIFYQFASFRFVEFLTRGSFGEVYTYAFLPLLLLGILRLFQKKSLFNFVFCAVSCALLILSHNSISLVFFGVASLFAFIFAKEKKDILFGFLALFLGLALSAFYWIPAIFEHKFTYGDLYMKNVYLDHFPNFLNFLIPNPLNDKAFQTHAITTQIGFFHTIAIGLSLYLFFWKKKLDWPTKRTIVFGLLIFLIGLFFMQPISKSVWERINFLRQFQFPWRFLSLIVVSSSLMSISYFSFSFIKKQVLYIGILILVVISTIAYWQPAEGFDVINEKYYWNYPLNTTYYGETDVIWSAGPAKAYPIQRIEVISGDAEILNISKRSNIQAFNVNAKDDSSIVSHTQYFPGWRVYIDGRNVPIQFQDPSWRGEITFNVPRGKHEGKIIFGESRVRIFADLISILSLVVVVFLLGFRKFYSK